MRGGVGGRRRGDIPWGVNVCTVVYQQVDDLLIPPGASNVDGEDPVEDGINWLSVSESVSDEAIIARGSSGMQPQIYNWRCGDELGNEEECEV